ncbi:MAG: EAL domain-containing protein [Solirubrobacteraceae bacterium]|nr:EAL domain-containing protein [Solirubrobacteraceae bacterium]
MPSGNTPTGRASGLLTAALTLAALYVAGRLVLPLAGRAVVDVWRLAAGVPLFWLSAAALVARAPRTGPARRAWQLLAAGIALYPVGTIATAIYGSAASAPPVAHAAWLAFYLCAYLALARLAHVAIRPFPSAFLLDGVAVVLAFGAAIAVTAELVGATPYRVWEAALGVAYPALDLILLAYTGWIASVTARPTTGLWRWLIAAFGLLFAADLVFVGLGAARELSPIAIHTAAYPVVMVLLARAGFAPPSSPVPLELDTRTAVAMPAAAVTILLGVLVVATIVSDGPSGPALPLAAASLVVLTARVILLQRAAVQLAATRRFERGFDEAGVGMGIADLSGRWVHVNAALASLLGHDADALVGRDVIEQVEGDQQAAASAVRAQLLRGAGQVDAVHLRVTVPGDTRDVLLTGDLVEGDDAPQFFVQVRDVTLDHRSRRHADAVSAISRQALALEDLDEVLARAVPRLVEALDADLVAWVPLDGTEPPLISGTGHAHDEGVLDDLRAGGSILLSGKGSDHSVVVDDPRAIELGLPHLHRAGFGHLILSRVQPRAAGRAVLCAAHHSPPERSEDARTCLDTIANVLATAADRAHDEQASRHRALHDPLTGLANRALLQAHLTQAIASGRRDGGSIAVLLIDLDRFKLVNDTLGHEIGDGLLRAVAERLGRHTRDGDLLARLGGDEFVLVMSRAHDATDVEAAAARIVAALEDPIEVGGRELHIGASTGIALMSCEYARPDALLHEADLAMYRAKRSGGAQWARADRGTRAQIEHADDLERDLREAVASGGLQVALQPQVRLGPEPGLHGFEALVRWARPGHGLLYPDAFLPLATTVGLLGDVGDCVLERALTFLAALPPEAGEPRLSINLLPAQLSASLPERVDRLSTAAGIPASRLTFEIPAGVLVTDEAAMDVVDRLRERGAAVVLEDFGTGWTSLSALQRHPIEAFKLDRGLVARLHDSPAAVAVARSCVRVADEFGASVIAAGVEDADQLGAVRALGISTVQGHLLAPPLLPDDAARYATARTWEPLVRS